MLEPVGALLYQEGLHMNTLIGTRRSRVGEGEKAVFGNYFLSSCILGMVN